MRRWIHRHGKPACVYVFSVLGAALAGILVRMAVESLVVREPAGTTAPVVAETGPAPKKAEKVSAGARGPGLSARDRRVIEQLLELTRDEPEIGQRMKTISARLLGRPYLGHPLIGSPVETEQLVVRMDGFDCVTFLETVLALAGADSVDGFLERLRRIRYEGGVISYRTRLHYMTDWSKSNIRRGFLRDLTEDVGPIRQAKTLSWVDGFRPRRVVLHYFYSQQIDGIGRWLEDGDLIYFVSGRNGLDVFHVGLVFREGERVLLRHASQSHRRVIDQDLVEFVRAHRMPGFILARPTENRMDRPRRAQAVAGALIPWRRGAASW